MSIQEVLDRTESSFISLYEVLAHAVEKDPQATYKTAATALLRLFEESDCPTWYIKYSLYGVQTSQKNEAEEMGSCFLVEVVMKGEEALLHRDETMDFGFRPIEIIGFLSRHGIKISDTIVNQDLNYPTPMPEFDMPSGKSRNTAAKIIAGLVLAGWKTSAHGGRINRISEVLSDLEDVGVTVDEGVLRTWLKDGADQFRPPKKT